MTNKEDYDLKRKNFIEKASRHFRYLCDEFGYLTPVHSTHQQPNGFILCDSLEYLNESIDRLIILYNAYHPNDYGFEVRFFRPSISTRPSERVMVYHVLKEDQDNDQSFL